MYLPAVMLVFDFVVGGNVKGTLVGIFVGHLYYFMREIYSRRYPAILAFLEAPAVL